MSSSWKHEGKQLRREWHFDTDPDQIYQAWADPQHVIGWFVDKASGQAKPGAKLEWSWERFGFSVTYEVLEAETNARLVMKPEGFPAILEIVLKPERGGTTLTLINSGFAEDGSFDDEYEGMNSGWARALASLDLYATRYWGQVKTPWLVMRPAQFEYEQLLPFYREPEQQRAWLLESGSFDHRAGKVSAQLIGGRKINGSMLVQTDRESTFEWKETKGVFELSAFKGGPSRMICVRGVGWGMSEDEARAIEKDLEPGMDRLLPLLGLP